MQIWLSSVWSHKCHVNHPLIAWNLWQELLVIPLETSLWMGKWPQMMKERARTDFPFNSSAPGTLEDLLTYCKAEPALLCWSWCCKQWGEIAQANSMLSTQISVSSITWVQQICTRSKVFCCPQWSWGTTELQGPFHRIPAQQLGPQTFPGKLHCAASYAVAHSQRSHYLGEEVTQTHQTPKSLYFSDFASCPPRSSSLHTRGIRKSYTMFCHTATQIGVPVLFQHKSVKIDSHSCLQAFVLPRNS